MRNHMVSKCLAMGFIAAFVLFFHSNPAQATTVAEAEFKVIVTKLGVLDAAVAKGACARCAATLEVIKKDLEQLSGPKAEELKKQVAGLELGISGLEVKLDALDRKVAQTGLAGNNAALTALTGINGVFGTGVALTSVKDGTATTEADDDEAVKTALACPVGYFADVSADYRQSGRRLHANQHFTCRKAEVPAAALALAPAAPSSRTLAGWALSGLAGAAAFGAAGWYAGNAAVPVSITDFGIRGGMGPPVAIVGALVGAVVGGVIYAAATQ